jgi:hypothetical protein
MLGRPEPFLWKPTSSSEAVAVCSSRSGAGKAVSGEASGYSHQLSARLLGNRLSIDGVG